MAKQHTSFKAIDSAIETVVANSLEDPEAKAIRLERNKSTIETIKSAGKILATTVAERQMALQKESAKVLGELSTSPMDEDDRNRIRRIHNAIWSSLLGKDIHDPVTPATPGP